MLTLDSVIQDPDGGGTATAKTYDIGWVLGVTPLNTLEEDESLVYLLGMADGMSTLNGGDEVITHVAADQSDPLPRAYVKGYSLRGELALGRETGAAPCRNSWARRLSRDYQSPAEPHLRLPEKPAGLRLGPAARRIQLRKGYFRKPG